MHPRPRLLLPLALTTLVLACRPATTEHPTPPPAPSIAKIVEWLAGEQVRSPKTSNRSVGLVLLDIDAKALGAGTLAPGSCAPNIVSVIPIPRATPRSADEWFGVDESPVLHRYSREGWAAVPSKVALPPLAKLLSIARDNDTSRRVLVYTTADNEQLWQLTLSAGRGDGDPEHRSRELPRSPQHALGPR